MRQASSFTPLEPATANGSTGLAAGFSAALNASAFSIPLSLGAVAVVYGRHAPGLLSAAVLATLLGLALVQLAGLGAHRPVLYSARFLEATTAAALLDSVAARLPAWGVADTPEVRVAALLALVACAGVAMAALYLVRANRLTRYIPTPVYAGFSNAIAIALLLSQSSVLMAAWHAPDREPLIAMAIAAIVLATGFAVRRWLPRWPAAATALGLGLLLGAALLAAGRPVAMVGTASADLSLPWFAADFRAFAAAPWLAVAGLLAGYAAILGAVMFLNTSLSAQMLSHQDDLLHDKPKRLAMSALAVGFGGLLGSAPISGSMQTSLVASRTARLGPHVAAPVMLIALAVAFSGLLGWIPIAAVAGALLCEAWFMLDRPSLRQLGQWLRRVPLRADARENLSLVAAVTATAVVLNIVAAVVAGLLLGLVLFAARNARRPARAVLTGAQVSSHCARSRAELQVLAQHGESLRIVEPEGDLFFVSVERLEQLFRSVLHQASCVVVDWSRVRSVDISVIEAVAKMGRLAAARGVPLFHVDPARASPEVAMALQLPARGGGPVLPDLDHALEQAENHLLALHGREGGNAATAQFDVMPIDRELDPDEKMLLQASMTHGLYRAGEVVMTAGAPGDALMVVLHGSASILVDGPEGAQVRIAGIRRGGLLGEMAFLDRSARSATVVAREDLSVAVLTREDYERLSREAPALVQKLLTSLALDLAARLRHTTQLASARQARH
ncbi:cyclic nucleotide-binding domain-containing protein [Ramlibacter sp.]|uniref:cyclic nucleotide-binding domain-containing protein n=1 Tax=Ramlibacter sp. TaxID=1917967 RepID=UPI002D2CFE17|nr:cyclic nucleotide-binding domain-containing protein [Ramlibacter sp.]HYD76650.1 cyclic nucleotide-binding domain-containing protein [Ramlibacter sp.]